MHPHRAGHYESPDETVALLALGSEPVTDSGINQGPTPTLGVAASEMVAESGTVTVAVGDFILIWTDIEFDAGVGNGTSQLIEQQVRDQTSHVWDTSFLSISSSTSRADTTRAIRLGPVGLLGQPAPGTYTFSLWALVAPGGAPLVTGAHASIVVMKTHG